MEFSHTGNLGDVCYGLVALAAFHKKTGSPSVLNLVTDVQAQYFTGCFHPSGNIRMTQEGAEFIKPLLTAQPYIEKVEIRKDKSGIPLDHFRDTNIKFNAGHLPRWYFYHLNINYNLGNPWLWVDSPKTNGIVINRSFRYRNNDISYAFMRQYDNIHFVGLEEEFIVCRKEIPNLIWLRTRDAFELAQVINSAKFFVGNQSLPFAIAESLKVPRILEICSWAPNVIPTGDNAYDFYFQEMFELIFKELNA